MKIWKRNAIIASVLLLVCAGVYLNWSKAQKSTAQDLTETLSAEQVMASSLKIGQSPRRSRLLGDQCSEVPMYR